MKEDVKKQLETFIETSGLSKRRVSNELGYASGSIVSLYLSGQYNGNIEELEKRIASYIERQGRRAEMLSIALVETEITKRIYNACDIAYEEKDIAIITGYAGNGKTTALKLYAGKKPNVVYIQANKSTTQHVLKHRLAKELSIPVKGSAAEITSRICEHLAAADILIIIDQADDLTDNALEYLRQVVNDEGLTGLVLAGLPKLRQNILNSRRDHDQLVSRIGLSFSLDSVDPDDLRSIMSATWPGADEEVIRCAIEESCIRTSMEIRASYRRLEKIMKRSHRLMQKNRLVLPSTQIIKTAAEFILKDQVW